MYASPPQYSHAPACKLIFDPLTSKLVSESRVTWATCVPILVFIGLSVLELFPMYATDRQTDVRRQTHRRQTASSFNAPPRGAGHNNVVVNMLCLCVFVCQQDNSKRRRWILMKFLWGRQTGNRRLDFMVILIKTRIREFLKDPSTQNFHQYSPTTSWVNSKIRTVAPIPQR